jgi:Zn-dependent peptidase ImmA (M78 family)
MNNHRNSNLIVAEREASNLIEEYGISDPKHIQLEDIAFDLGVRVVKGPLNGAVASLTRYGNSGTIRVPNNETYLPKIRFSIAHELGHFVLNHGHSIQKICNMGDMHAWHVNSGEEAEANIFASELLLPKKLLDTRCQVEDISFKPILNIAEEFNTSLMATAIKFVHLCPIPCAVVYSEESGIKWSCRSETWDTHIPKNLHPKQGTVAYDLFNSLPFAEEPVEVRGKLWLGRNKIKTLMEHSKIFSQWNYVLTLLWIK